MDSSIEAAVSRVNCFRCPISRLVDFDDLSRVFQSSITHETGRGEGLCCFFCSWAEHLRKMLIGKYWRGIETIIERTVHSNENSDDKIIRRRVLILSKIEFIRIKYS